MGSITTQKVINELKRIKKSVAKQYKIDSMFLFGSRARGDELLSSDADVIVISKDFSLFHFRKRPDAFLDRWKLPIDLEILCYSPEEFRRKKKEYGLVQEAVKQKSEV